MSGSSLLSLFVNSICEWLQLSLSHHSLPRGRPALHRSGPCLLFPPAESPFFPTNFSISLPQWKAPFCALTPHTAASSFLQLLAALLKLGLPCKCNFYFHVASPFRHSWIITLSFFLPFHHRDILKSGGTAVDAAIAGLICTSVMNPQSSGLGGGVVFTIYNASTGMGQPWPLHGAPSPCRHPAAVKSSESFMFSQGNFLKVNAASSDHKPCFCS